MYIPLTRERVRVSGRSTLYRVVRADYERQIASVVTVDQQGPLAVEEVPFDALFAVFENPEARKAGQPEISDEPRAQQQA